MTARYHFRPLLYRCEHCEKSFAYIDSDDACGFCVDCRNPSRAKK